MRTVLAHRRRTVRIIRTIGLPDGLGFVFCIVGTCLSGPPPPIFRSLFGVSMVFRTEAIELYVAPARNYSALPNPKARNWLLMYLTMVAGDPVAPRDGDAAAPIAWPIAGSGGQARGVIATLEVAHFVSFPEGTRRRGDIIRETASSRARACPTCPGAAPERRCAIVDLGAYCNLTAEGSYPISLRLVLDPLSPHRRPQLTDRNWHGRSRRILRTAHH